MRATTCRWVAPVAGVDEANDKQHTPMARVALGVSVVRGGWRRQAVARTLVQWLSAMSISISMATMRWRCRTGQGRAGHSGS